MKSAKPIDKKVELLSHLIANKRSAYKQIEAGRANLGRANAALGAFAESERGRAWKKYLRNGKPQEGSQ